MKTLSAENFPQMCAYNAFQSTAHYIFLLSVVEIVEKLEMVKSCPISTEQTKKSH